MLDLETGEPLIELDGRLIEESQKTLARLSVAQRAYELLKSQCAPSTAGRLDRRRARAASTSRSCSRRSAGSRSTPCASRNSSPMTGFQRAFIEPLGDIAERIKKERWVLGAAGEQTALAAQYDNLPDQMLAALHPRFRRRLARGARQAAAAASC